VVNWPGHESGQSPALSAEVQNEGSYKSAFPICLHDVGRDKVSFTFCYNINNPVHVLTNTLLVPVVQSECLRDVKI
jgi:hypothetical protein